MADLYALVTSRQQRTRRRKRDRILITVIAGVLLLAVGVLLITRLADYSRRVRNFRSQLNNCTIYAYDNDCLRAEVNGVAVRVSGDHNYDVYQCLSVRSLGANALFTPRSDPAAILDYGEGSVLRLWPDRDGRGAYIRFDSADGHRCIFHSRDVRATDLISRYLAPEKNTLWDHTCSGNGTDPLLAAL